MNETHGGEQRPGSSLPAGGSIEGLLADFDRHLEGQQGCVEATRKNYQREARAFLAHVFPTQSINWEELTAGKVAEFVGSRAKKLSLVSRQNPAVAIRSLLRFLAGKGLIRMGLEGAIPPIWRTKHATLPRHVSPEQLENMLALCSSEERPGAMRDRAMILLCARLGLRPGEVLSLTVSDLDWSAGSVLIRAGKTSRERALPVPEDAGTALARYLQGCAPGQRRTRRVPQSRSPAQTHPQRPDRDPYGQSTVAASGNRCPVLRRLRSPAHASHNHGAEGCEFQTCRRHLGT